MHRGTQTRGVVLLRHNRHMWQDELDGFVQHLRAGGAAPSTVRLRRMHLERALTWLGLAPFTVTTTDLEGYLAAHEWAAETRKSVRSSLRAFYGWAEDAGHVDTSPARRLPNVTVPQGKPKPTPDDVMRETMSTADERTRLMVMLAAYAGLRRAEIAGLHADDIVDDSLRITGKGGKVRRVPLHPDLAAALAGVRGYVFPGDDGGHLSPDRVGRIVSRALKGKGWTAHTLRHRFATRAYAGERDLLTVQQLLGHSSVATTQRYTQIPDDALRRAVGNVA